MAQARKTAIQHLRWWFQPSRRLPDRYGMEYAFLPMSKHYMVCQNPGYQRNRIASATVSRWNRLGWVMVDRSRVTVRVRLSQAGYDILQPL